MDPALMGMLALLISMITRLSRLWITSRTTVRLAQLNQQGLNDRARCLPQGSRLSESFLGREVVIEIGSPDPRDVAHG
jgi:hypothetical protein